MILRLLFASLLPLLLLGASQTQTGRPYPPWERGILEIHQINTGKGDAAFFIFPDGTTFLLDAGAVVRDRPPRYDSPQRPDASLRPGQWIARYIHTFHPRGPAATLDYAALTHFHGDHMGTLSADSPPAAAGSYRLTGITDVAEEVPVRILLDRAWPEYDVPAPLDNEMMRNYRAFLDWQIQSRGLRVERFQAGRADQIALVHEPAAFPNFEVRNIAANGTAWTGAGEEVRSRFPSGSPPDENNCSLAFRLSYGAFVYFNGGDMPGYPRPEGAWSEMESAVAWAVGPVDAHALNHHGTGDSANEFFLSVLQPQVHILSVYAASQPSPDLLRRLLSETLYPGPRDVFLTNAFWEGRGENLVTLYGEEETAWLLDQLREASSAQGHVVLRVDPGGDRFHVYVLDDSTPAARVVSVHGPYRSRGRR